ncbi:exported hypothetical protein [uncultured Gammaproteobacteria bacterium]
MRASLAVNLAIALMLATAAGPARAAPADTDPGWLEQVCDKSHQLLEGGISLLSALWSWLPDLVSPVASADSAAEFLALPEKALRNFETEVGAIGFRLDFVNVTLGSLPEVGLVFTTLSGGRAVGQAGPPRPVSPTDSHHSSGVPGQVLKSLNEAVAKAKAMRRPWLVLDRVNMRIGRSFSSDLGFRLPAKPKSLVPQPVADPLPPISVVPVR